MISSIKQPQIKGIHYAGTTDRGLISAVNLDDLPSPILTGVMNPHPFIRWETKRGCPFSCSFCQYKEPKINHGSKDLPLHRVLQEADWITSHPEIVDISVVDATFNYGKTYLQVLDRLAANGFTGKIALECRPELVTKNFLDSVSQLNETATVVLEFGLQTIHEKEQQIINRLNNMTKIAKILQEVKQRNIMTEITLIYGLPRQTLESFKKTIAFCTDFAAFRVRAFPLMLLPGTALAEQKTELSLCEATDLQSKLPHVIASPTFSYQEWLKMKEIALSLEEYNLSSQIQHSRRVRV